MLADVSAFEAEYALDAFDVGVVVLDAQVTVVGWNDWIVRASGISKQAALGKPLLSVFPVLHQTRLPAAVNDSLQVGSSSILTHTLNKLLPLHGDDGSDLLHNIVVRPVSSGRSVCCLLQISDVTVSVTRERVLRDRQNARYHAIVDSARDAIITTAADRTIHWVNGAAEKAFGYSSTEMVGQPIDMLIERGEPLDIGFLGAAASSKSANFQVAGRRKTGELLYFAVSLGRWKADDRVFTTTIWRDVTQQLAAEAGIRESEARQRALLEALPQLVWTCRPDGNCDYYNPQWQEYTGAPAEQHLRWAWLNIVHAEDRQRLESAWRLSLANGTVFDVDARLCRANGSHRWFKLRSVPMRNEKGEIARWFGTATEITDLVEARDTLRRSNEELEAAVVERTREREVALKQLHESQKMESIGQLTGGVAHDFNNLLAVILGNLALLRKNLSEDSRASRLIDGAIQGAERGANLTRRLLAFARRQELKLEAVDIAKLVPDLTEFLRQSVGPGISIVFDVAPDVHPVKIDANQFELALMNLAVNARDAMPNGGLLTIGARDYNAGEQFELPKQLPRGEYVHISVADTGVGMNEATLSKAMEPFFTTKGVGKGTGLGLSMVHGLAAQSGGAIHITSQPGKGTVVHLWLPPAEQADLKEIVPQTEPAAREGVGGSKVLLVDDDALVSMGTADMLMDLGHSVTEASSGMQALQILEANPHFDVVVTDYAMPGMTGLDLAAKIKQLRPHMPIIIATGYAELPGDAPDDFLRLDKPYTQGELAQMIGIASRGATR
jgi:PAS domain S-box-containing protein